MDQQHSKGWHCGVPASTRDNSPEPDGTVVTLHLADGLKRQKVGRGSGGGGGGGGSLSLALLRLCRRNRSSSRSALNRALRIHRIRHNNARTHATL